MLTGNWQADDGFTGRTGRIALEHSPQVPVTLSDDLLNQLWKPAQEQHVPLRWLVTGLVCDILETRIEHPHDDRLHGEC